ncbi:MAG: hypothetical protein E6J70_17660 [Deltaproteobacteria bacterium]|nr:MAG: hypothetical protein E6J70_17660 [Deltaproteobacteria bacterium]
MRALSSAGRNGGTSGSGSRAGSRPASSSTSSSSSARPCSAAGRAAGRAPGHRSSVRCGRRSGAANACLPRSARSSAVSSCRKPSVGARPSPSSVNCVVARDAAAAWTERLLAAEWPRPEAYAFALAQLARATGDRGRDLDPELRERLARRLETAPHGERAARIVREPVALEAREEARLLDETLPAGLRLRGDV